MEGLELSTNRGIYKIHEIGKIMSVRGEKIYKITGYYDEGYLIEIVDRRFSDKTHYRTKLSYTNPMSGIAEVATESEVDAFNKTVLGGRPY